MADLISMLSAASGATAEADPNFKQTVLLLHGDGTNGAQNNTFLDSSTNNFTITRNGNTTQGTFSPFSLAAGEWSNFFDTSGDSLTVPYSSTLALGTGDCTIEAWIYLASYPQQFNNIVDVRESSVSYSNNAISFGVENDGTLNFYAGSYSDATHVLETASGKITLNAWYHVALTRASGTTKLYVNGVEEASSTNAWNQTSGTATTLYIGNAVVTRQVNGYISNLRIVKGTAVTPPSGGPTAPLTAVTNTALLTCQSNRFVDNSSNAFAITRNGDVRVTPFSPFAPTAAYSAGTNGGSGYFDGSGDSLTYPPSTSNQFGTGDFTVESWVYLNAAVVANSAVYIFDTRTASVTASWNFGMRFIGGTGTVTLDWFNGTAVFAGTGEVPVGQWNHCVYVRSGTTGSLYLNGVRVGTQTDSTNYSSTGATATIGSRYATPFNYTTGYYSQIRIVKGTAVYDPTQTTLTVPTAPLTSITNTSLLLNFTNAGIIDNTGKNVLETVGNAQIDTTTKKYGTGSLEFDGTGDWLLMPNTPDQQLGTGNFTIEFWVYLASGDTGLARGLVAKGGASTGWLVSLDSSQKVVFTYTTSTITSSGAITTNAWNHIAVVRSGTGSNQTKIYIGGTNDGTGTVSTNFNQTESMYVGANRTGGDPMKGFIDDLRITKGIARYTANFSVPGKAFPDL